MVKKCIICEEEAAFRIKEGSEFYCKECAQESFADLSLLQKFQQEAIVIKDLVNGKLQNN